MTIARTFIVAKEPILHGLYKYIMELKGHKVIGEAYDFKMCIEMLRRKRIKPDIILLDHKLPNINALEGTRKLLRVNPKLKIILISQDKSIRDEALSTGAKSFIQKPFNIRTLVECI